MEGSNKVEQGGKSNFEISVERRVGLGGAESRRVRRQGKVPSIVYSHGQESVPAAVDAREFIKLASVSRSSRVFKLKSTDSTLDGRSALVKQIQKDVMKGTLLHIDFHAVREDEEINVSIPLKFIGEAPGVKADGGILAIVVHELDIRCFPRFIPEEIVVDIGSLKIGDSIHARDLNLAKEVKLSTGADETVVSVVAARAAAEEEVAPAAAVAAGAAATAAATPVADAKKPAADAKK